MSKNKETQNKLKQNPHSIVVMGAGAWGTALAIQAHRAGNQVKLWAYLEDEKTDIETFGENKGRLPGVPIPSEISVHNELTCVHDADYVLIVTPAQAVSSFLKDLKSHLSPHTKVIFCSKGIEISSGKLLSEIAADSIPKHEIGFLSGPNFAKEIARGEIAASTIAFSQLESAQEFAKVFSSPHFRAYPTEDVIGVQVGGAYKNVLAIAAGLLKGFGYGENALAAMLTRGLAELTRFSVFKGGVDKTSMTLAGIGDLMLCGYSTTSRNMKLGFDIGEAEKGQKERSQKKKTERERQSSEFPATKDSMVDTKERPLTEGAYTVEALHKIAKAHDLDLPLCEAVYHIIFHNQTIRETETLLLSRPLIQHENM